MVIRTYFDRNNTIVSNLPLNTGKNPVCELFYGGSSDGNFSRFIFQFDVSRIIDFRNKGMFPDLTKFKHTLRMTNTGAFDTELLGGKTTDGKDRSTSFDLVVFPVTQQWDEGIGYDYYKQAYMGSSTSVVETGPSNWFEASTNESWENEGIFTGSPTVITTQHFEDGNENIEMDITEIVNSYLTGATNYGLGLAYVRDLEETISDNGSLQYVGFFTRHSQTFYEPFVESVYNDPIKDDRANFYLDRDNKLYLYVNAGGKPTNLDNLPSVTIYDDGGDVILEYPSSAVTRVSQGVYSIDVNISSDGQNDCTIYTDVWSGISINGNNRPDVELEFSVKSEGYYNIGAEMTPSKSFIVNVSGMKANEKIKRGDIRRVNLNPRLQYTTAQTVLLEDLQYRLYVKEGRNQYTVIDYTDTERAFNQNYFLLDTASLLPNTYYLDVKYSYNQDVITLPEVIKFEIVSQSDLRKSQ